MYKKTMIILFGIIVLGMVFWLSQNTNTPLVSPSPTSTNANKQPVDTTDFIAVEVPTANAVITSPVQVKGRVTGLWFFEGSFPVSVVDGNGKVLGAGPVSTPGGEWMTPEVIPFAGKIPFNTPSTATGTIIFQKDNPSDLSELDREYRLPVRFGP